MEIEKINQSLDRRQMAESIVHQINGTITATIIGLHILESHCLYRDLGYDSMKTLVQSGRLALSWGTAARYLRLAHRFGDEIQGLDDKQTRLLLANMNDPNANVVDGQVLAILPDGSEMDFEEYLNQIKPKLEEEFSEKIKSENKEAISELKQVKKELRQAKTKAENESNLRQKTEHELEKYKSQIEYLSKGDVDPMRLERIANRDKAVSIINQSFAEILRQISVVNDIPDQIEPDDEICQHIQHLTTALDDAKQSLLNKWNEYLFERTLGQ